MRIVVPIKRVVDPYSKVKPLADGSGIDTSAVKFEINPFDEIAMEESVRIKEREAGTEIIAVSLGGAECEEQLRKALAIGADRAVLIEADGAMDSTVVAAELAAFVREMAPDLVLMGKQATDDDNNQAGQMLAALLEWPQATFACKVDFAASEIHVTRETDTGTETLAMPMPCVITTDLRLNEPRYVALPGIIKARSKPLDRRPRSTSSAPKTSSVHFGAPKGRSEGRKLDSVQELIAEIKARGFGA